MTDWADERAAFVNGSPDDIAAALRTEQELGRQIAAEKDARIAELTKQLAAERRVSLDRLKMIKGMNKREKAR